MDVCRSRFWHTGNQIQHVAEIGLTGGQNLTDPPPIDIGQLDRSAYEEVQYEAQTLIVRYATADLEMKRKAIEQAQAIDHTKDN